MDEIWCPIAEFDIYSVSTQGRVRNDHTGRLVKQSTTARGAAKVGLFHDKQQRSRSVKLLVADSFLEGQTHIFNTPINLNGDPQDNRVENLMWRPRWFACIYSRQFHPPIGRAHYRGPVINLDTQESHENVIHAGMADGVLFREIHASAVQQRPVFPLMHQYYFPPRK